MKPVSSRTTWWSVAVMLLLGAGSGALWAALAQPAEWEVRADGSVVLTQIASRDQFGVIVVFVLIGAAVALVWGFATTFLLKDLGWRLTPLVAVVTLLAAVIAWRVGVALGPVGPREAVDPAVGDRLPSRLALDGLAPLMVWPTFGVLGVFLATLISGTDEADLEVQGSAGEPRDDG